LINIPTQSLNIFHYYDEIFKKFLLLVPVGFSGSLIGFHVVVVIPELILAGDVETVTAQQVFGIIMGIEV
jgi:hypothetical protein